MKSVIMKEERKNMNKLYEIQLHFGKVIGDAVTINNIAIMCWETSKSYGRKGYDNTADNYMKDFQKAHDTLKEDGYYDAIEEI